ncbi:MAG: hypothetical protein HYV27_19990 [Candidatus Hydrogenedentes bacterium]|nr:hypothetical protein [Candidatus Hydrogenedentota bacterium]
MTDTETYIGAVRSVAPQRREVRIALAVSGLAVAKLLWCVFELRNGVQRRFKVEQARGHGSEAVVLLVAGVPREQIALLEGARVFATLPEPDAAEDVLKTRDLLDFAVYGDGGVKLGTVTAVYESPGQDTLVIAAENGMTWLLPAIAPVIAWVDMEAERVELGEYRPHLVEEAE